jgi:hypothetical protein
MNEGKLPKPKLIPVEVPWTIPTGSMSSPIRLEYMESEPVTVHCAGWFYRVSPSEADKFQGQLQLIRIVFHCAEVIWARITPSEIAESTDEYDENAVRVRPNPGEGVYQLRNRNLNKWTESGVCHDPSMYEVHGSEWLQSVGKDDPILKHYLIIGHDIHVELLAHDWTWELVGEPWGIILFDQDHNKLTNDSELNETE